MTVITGFQQSPDSLNKLLKQLKSQCGSGGTMKDDTLEIQGDHRQKRPRTRLNVHHPRKVITHPKTGSPILLNTDL